MMTTADRQAWPDLPESDREAVLRIVAEARQGVYALTAKCK